MGDNKLTFDDTVSTPTEDLTIPDSKYFIIDAKNFYLNNPTKKKIY